MNVEKYMQQFCIRKLFLWVCFYCFSMTIYAAADNAHSWENIGPEGGGIGELVISPSDPDIVYAVTDNSLLRSDNGGEQWELVQSIEEFSLPRGRRLLIDPINPDILFARDKISNTLIRSEDGGKSWQSDFKDDAFSFFSLNTPVSQPLRKVVFNDSKTEQKIATSVDGGESWLLAEQAINLVGGQFSKVVGIDPNNSSVLYGLIADDFGSSTLHKSFDGGANWFNTEPSASKGMLFHHKLIIHPVNSDVLFAQFLIDDSGSQLRWFSSQNGGESWEPIASINGDNDISQLIIDPNDARFLYATVNPRFLGTAEETDLIMATSVDFGKHWELIDRDVQFAPQLIYRTKIVVHPDNNQHLFLISEAGIFKSLNGGIDWQASHSGIQLLGGDLSVDPSDQNIMYIFRPGFNLDWFKSIDGGKQWDVLTGQMEDEEGDVCASLVFNPKNSQEVLCYAKKGLYRSTNAGVSWHLFKSQKGVSYVTYSEDGNTIYYIAIDELGFNQSIFKMTEINGVWSDADVHPTQWHPSSSLLVDPRNSNVIYTVGQENFSRSVYKSQDGGETWKRQIGAIYNEGKLIMHPYYPDRLAFADGGVISLSDTGGKGWVRLPDLSETIGGDMGVLSLVFNPRHRDGLFLLLSTGVYESKDLGKSWNIMDLELLRDERLVFQRVDDEVYATTLTRVLKLTHAPYTEEAKDCLFTWAEQKYPSLFRPAFENSRLFGDYIYRYYSETNTYLGFFQDKKVHLLEKNKANTILDVGFVEYYQALSGCDAV